jgi:hypothetical protein
MTETKACFLEQRKRHRLDSPNVGLYDGPLILDPETLRVLVSRYVARLKVPNVPVGKGSLCLGTLTAELTESP